MREKRYRQGEREEVFCFEAEAKEREECFFCFFFPRASKNSSQISVHKLAFPRPL